MGEIFHKLAFQRESQILEGHLCIDHVYIYILISANYSVSQAVGAIKGKSAILISREVQRRARGFAGQSFLACVFLLDRGAR